MNTKKLFMLLVMTIVFQLHSQEHHGEDIGHENESSFRLVGVIGHTLVNNEGLDNVIVPSWGLDLEYWFNHKWGIGLHNDIEIETFVIKNAEEEEIERINPIVLTLDALYHFGNGFVLTVGPGVEIEKEGSYYLARLGIEYEKDISNIVYVVPNFFLDQRLDGYNTFNIGLGIGMKL